VTVLYHSVCVCIKLTTSVAASSRVKRFIEIRLLVTIVPRRRCRVEESLNRQFNVVPRTHEILIANGISQQITRREVKTR
jgi:hypothetical protein